MKGNISTETNVFLCEIFAISIAEIRQMRHIIKKRPITTYSLWEEISEEEFNVLRNIIKDEFKLGMIKFEIFFEVIDKYRTKYKLKANRIRRSKWSKTEKGKVSLKKTQQKYYEKNKNELNAKRKRYRNGRNN